MSNASSKKAKAVKPVDETAPKDNSGWGPLSAFVVTSLIFFLGQFLAGVALLIVPFLMHWNGEQAMDWLNSTAGQFSFVVLAEIFTLGLLWWFLRRRRGSFRQQLGLDRKPLWSDLAYVLGGFVVYFGLLILASALVGQLFNVNVDQKQELGFNHVSGLSDKLMTLVSLVVLPPVVEEIVFRGFLYGGLRTKLGFASSTLITSALFAVPHLFESGDGGGLLWIGAVDTFVLSLVLCYAREKTGALWASIGLHFIKNGLAFVYLFVIAAG